MKNYLRGFLFSSEDIKEPEDEFAYEIENAIDSTDSITSSEEFMDFINSSMFYQEPNELCFLFMDSNDRIVDCGLGNKFAEQSEFENTYVNYTA